MSSENVRVERDGYVATVTIDRPGTRNACTFPMWLQIRDVFQELTASDARVIVLTGANGDFCSGADVSGPKNAELFQGPDITAMRLVSQSVLAVNSCPIPVIAKVDGVAVGAGLGLALAGDLLYCSDRARFGAIFAKVGMSLDFGSSWLLQRRVGLIQAKEMVFTTDMVKGPDAVDKGLANAVHPADDLDAAVDEIAARIAAGPPIALSLSKKMLDDAATGSLAQALEREAMAQSLNLKTHDTKEALFAFRERRTPNFEGR